MNMAQKYTYYRIWRPQTECTRPKSGSQLVLQNYSAFDRPDGLIFYIQIRNTRPNYLGNRVQVGLVIRGRYVPLFWTANTKFADKKTHFDWKFGILAHFFKCE